MVPFEVLPLWQWASLDQSAHRPLVNAFESTEILDSVAEFDSMPLQGSRCMEYRILFRSSMQKGIEL